MFKLPTHIKPKYLCLSILALSLCAAASTKMEDYINFTLKIEDSMGKGKITGAFAMKDNLNPENHQIDSTSRKMLIQRVDQNNKTIWKVQDFVQDCEVDNSLELAAPVTITDLDGNGYNEIWMVYRLACRGDISPSAMKIIMYEGTTKYAMRGESLVYFPDGDGGMQGSGGSYKYDEAFADGKSEFLSYAKSLWERYKREF